MIIEAKFHEAYMGGRPLRATDESAGIDLLAITVNGHELLPSETFVIPVGQTVTIGTGVRVDLGSHNVAGLNAAAMILPRSGLGCKGLKPANSPGLLDGDYHGEVKVCLTNQGTEAATIRRCDRIAQMVIVPYLVPAFAIVNEFTRDTGRGEGGFGSTGA